MRSLLLGTFVPLHCHAAARQRPAAAVPAPCQINPGAPVAVQG